jgi:Coiled stalk of trimeric autotransporter adhesin
MPVEKFYGLDLASQKIENVGDGTSATDGVNLGQLWAVQRGKSWKDAVRAASTGNVTLATPGASMDGVTLTNPSRVLLKNQTTGAENGIYDWTGAATPLSRAVDADSTAELNGATVSVLQGTVNGNLVYTQTADDVVVGTDAIAWAYVGGDGGFTVAGSGLTGSGVTVDVGQGTGISVGADAVGIDTAVVPRYVTQDSTASATITVTHNWNSRKVGVEVVNNSTGGTEHPSLVRNLNTVVVTFPSAVGAGDYTVNLTRFS